MVAPPYTAHERGSDRPPLSVNPLICTEGTALAPHSEDLISLRKKVRLKCATSQLCHLSFATCALYDPPFPLFLAGTQRKSAVTLTHGICHWSQGSLSPWGSFQSQHRVQYVHCVKNHGPTASEEESAGELKFGVFHFILCLFAPKYPLVSRAVENGKWIKWQIITVTLYPLNVHNADFKPRGLRCRVPGACAQRHSYL